MSTYPVEFKMLEETIVKLNAEVKSLRTANERLKAFLNNWNGHEPGCGRNREGFEGCDEAMFNCDCGYEKAKRQALPDEG